MLSTANITMQFGAKPLFENISVKFGEGNRYGLIGANGCGKSTFMKILGGDLEPIVRQRHARPERAPRQAAPGPVRVRRHARARRRDDGPRPKCGTAMTERDAIYANPDATEDDYMHAAELEAKFAEYDGYTAEARAGELLLGIGIAIEQHNGPMSDVAPGWKLRVLLAQALFSNPDILLLDEPTNNLDINSIRWLEDVLNARTSHHDHHLARSPLPEQVCTHMADMDYGTLKVYPGNYDDYMLASTQAREQQLSDNAKAKEQIADLQDFVRRFSANKSKARQATSRAQADRKDQDRGHQAVVAASIRSSASNIDEGKAAPPRGGSGTASPKATTEPLFPGRQLPHRSRASGSRSSARTASARPRCCARSGGRARARTTGTVKWAENAKLGYYAAGSRRRVCRRLTLIDWMTSGRGPSDDDQMVRGTLGRLLFSGDDVEEVGEGAVRRREGPHDVRQADAAPAQRAADGRADQPHGHGIDRVAEHRARNVQRHADLRRHDREFVSSLATRIIEITAKGVSDYHGTYDISALRAW